MLFIAFSGSMAALISSDPIGRTQYSVIAGGKKWNGEKINCEKINGKKRNGEKINIEKINIEKRNGEKINIEKRNGGKRNGKKEGWNEQLKRMESSEKVRD